ncbi:hypothetical protein KKHLCK_04750 [Candidatus Electrothrix laxa]
MKSSKKSTPPGNPSFDCINRLFLNRLLTFCFFLVARLFQAARTFNIPNCYFSRFAALIRHNKFLNSFQSEVRFVEFRAVAVDCFLILPFFRMQIAESCSDAPMRIYADRYRCGGKDTETLLSPTNFRQENSVACCELKQRRRGK